MSTTKQSIATQFIPAQFKGTDFVPKETDMNLYARSLAQRQARQDEANKSYADVTLELAKIQEQLHNDKETKEWFNNYANNKILQPLQEQIDAGNYGNAKNYAVRSAAEIFNDPQIQGRIRSNKLYEAEKSKIDADNSLDKLTKQRWADVNKFYYNDVYNDNGDVIAGDEWQATFNPVADVNLETLQSLAFQLTSEESKDTTTSNTKDILVNKYGDEIDEDLGIGKTDEETRILSDALYRTATGLKGYISSSDRTVYKKKDYDKLTRVWNRIINEDPSRLTALKQKYDTYIWALNKANNRRNDTNLSEEERIRADKDYAIYKERLTDKNGFIYDTMDDWAKAVIIPGFKDLAYNIKTTNNANIAKYNESELIRRLAAQTNEKINAFANVEDASTSGAKVGVDLTYVPGNYDIDFSSFFNK